MCVQMLHLQGRKYLNSVMIGLGCAVLMRRNHLQTRSHSVWDAPFVYIVLWQINSRMDSVQKAQHRDSFNPILSLLRRNRAVCQLLCRKVPLFGYPVSRSEPSVCFWSAKWKKKCFCLPHKLIRVAYLFLHTSLLCNYQPKINTLLQTFPPPVQFVHCLCWLSQCFVCVCQQQETLGLSTKSKYIKMEMISQSADLFSDVHHPQRINPPEYADPSAKFRTTQVIPDFSSRLTSQTFIVLRGRIITTGEPVIFSPPFFFGK